MSRRTTAAGLAALLLLGLPTACTSGSDQPRAASTPAPSPSPSGSPSAASSAASSAGARDAAAGYSTPVEDRVYPDVGDPGVDALHYDLHLSWTPATHTLVGDERLHLRSTTDATELRLDLGAPLQVTGVRVDGRAADFDHAGKELVVHHDVARDGEYTLRIGYRGTPRPVRAPVQRTDFSRTGWTITRDGGAWTMQEPFGAYSWYAVNDQPSDKALYDVTISAPAPMVGVSNGRLLARRTTGGHTVTHWRLDEPASSYLVTVAVGRFTMTRAESASGLPLTYWTPPDRPDLLRRVRHAAQALDWVEGRLGPFPFSSLGILVVDSRSGMETQTMITLGDTRYATSPEVLVHEITHQWYGDEVTPADWRDVWMNEGMATYVQGVWQAEQQGVPLSAVTDGWASVDRRLRAEAGPPADYDPTSFGAANIYFSAALMWDALRRKVGDEEFWRLVRAWPSVHDDGNASYGDITSWWSQQTGQDLSGFFHDWLLARTPPRP